MSNKKNSRKSSTNSSTMRLRPVWVVVLCILAVLLVILLFRACSKTDDDTSSNASISVIDMNAGVQTIEETRAVEQTSVKIDIPSCKVVVGEKIYVTATVTPANTDRSLQWKSSDDKVFRVSQDGIVEITGTGTAALTATVGNVSDAIVIEGIEKNDSKSQMNLPSYNEVSSSDNTDADSNADNDGQPQQETQAAADRPKTTQAAMPSVKVVSRGLRSYQLADVLGGLGFHSTGDNVFVYGEGDDYSGEIIVQPDVSIIYIKKNSADYESAVQSVLQNLLPDEYTQAWSNYTSAATDRTFTLESRTVRIVTAGNGGHSQIVVYN